MAEHPYMPFFAEKFFADTLHLPWDARAVYLELLALAWNRGGALPNDEDKLRRMIGCRIQKWRLLWRHIQPFWMLGDDGQWHQKRLDREWKRVATWKQNVKVLHTLGSQSEQHDGKKSSKIKGTHQNPRARAQTHTHTEKNSLVPSESSSLARAALCVRTHASPALRLIENTELSPVPDDPSAAEELTAEQRVKIAEGLARLAASISGVKNLDDLAEAAGGTKAEVENRKAEEKLNALAKAEKPILALSPLAKASPLVGRDRRANGGGT